PRRPDPNSKCHRGGSSYRVSHVPHLVHDVIGALGTASPVADEGNFALWVHGKYARLTSRFVVGGKLPARRAYYPQVVCYPGQNVPVEKVHRTARRRIDDGLSERPHGAAACCGTRITDIAFGATHPGTTHDGQLLQPTACCEMNVE